MIFRLFLKCKIYRRTFHVQNSKLSPALGALMDLRSDSLGGGASFRARRTRRWWDNDAAQQDRRVTPERNFKEFQEDDLVILLSAAKTGPWFTSVYSVAEFVSPYLGAAYTCSLARSISIFFLQTYMCVCDCIHIDKLKPRRETSESERPRSFVPFALRKSKS